MKKVIFLSLLFLIVILHASSVPVGMDDGAGARVPMRVVPHNTEAAYSIQVHILETEVGNVQMFPFIIRFRAVVSHTYRERSVEEPVLGENPVVSIAAGYVHIAVFHLAEH